MRMRSVILLSLACVIHSICRTAIGLPLPLFVNTLSLPWTTLWSALTLTLTLADRTWALCFFTLTLTSLLWCSSYLLLTTCLCTVIVLRDALVHHAREHFERAEDVLVLRLRRLLRPLRALCLGLAGHGLGGLEHHPRLFRNRIESISSCCLSDRIIRTRTRCNRLLLLLLLRVRVLWRLRVRVLLRMRKDIATASMMRVHVRWRRVVVRRMLSVTMLTLREDRLTRIWSISVIIHLREYRLTSGTSGIRTVLTWRLRHRCFRVRRREDGLRRLSRVHRSCCALMVRQRPSG